MIYRVLSYLIFGLGLPLWLLFRPRLRAGLLRRLGFYGDRSLPWPAGGRPRLWFHGASAGDVRALRPVIRHVRAALPEATIVVSSVTDTGHRLARVELSDVVDGVTYAPIDLPGATRRTVAALQPDVLVFEYAELWPHLLAAAQSSGARLLLGNGRLHPDRMPGYRWLSWLTGSPLRRFDRLLMRSADDAERARVLGAPADRTEVTGNTKFDDLLPSSPSAPGAVALADARWWVAGSTHAEDEGPVLAAFAALRVVDPEARLLLVPRYPERATQVAAAVRRWRWSVTCASLDGDASSLAEDVVVVNVVGRLRESYRRAAVAFVGGSFGRRGGHNILEPAAAGVPVVCGPDLANNEEAVALLRGRGLIQVADAATLSRVLIDLWTDRALAEGLGRQAAAAAADATGASRRNADVVIELAREAQGQRAQVGSPERGTASTLAAQGHPD